LFSTSILKILLVNLQKKLKFLHDS
jgi:hypothetical protein